MPAALTRDGDVLEIKLEGRWSEIAEAKDKVKAIDGRRWDPSKSVWTVPADPATADLVLKLLRPDVDDELLAWIKESMVEDEVNLTTVLPDDCNMLQVHWAYGRCNWQPETVNDEPFNGLLPYQRAAVDAIAREKHIILADEMGLGKTLEAISAVEEYVLRNPAGDGTIPSGPRLVVAPASVLGSWGVELERWLDNAPVQVVDASSPAKRHEQLQRGILDDAWCIVNWEQLRVKPVSVKLKRGGTKKLVVMKQPLFQYPAAAYWELSSEDWEDVATIARAEKEFGKADPHWLAVVADEAHRAKNRNAQQTQGLHRVRGILQIAATGTPIMNSPDELWSLLAWLWPDKYHKRGHAHKKGAVSYGEFYERHVAYWEDHFGKKVITGVKDPDRLRYDMRGKLIRRTAKILGLKGRHRNYYPAPMVPAQAKLYKEAEKSMWLAVSEQASAGNKDAIAFAAAAAEGASPAQLMRIPNGAARFVRLQQILENAALLGGPDASGAMDDFEQKFEDSRPDPWLVFCKYTASCDLIAERMRKKFGAEVGIFTGDVSTHHRTEMVAAYQRGEIDVIVGTIAAMYQGITLTRGNKQFWLSREVVPAINEQGEARQDRLGQQELVQVYIPQAPNTVASNKVQVINDLKTGIVAAVVPQDEIKETRNA